MKEIFENMAATTIPKDREHVDVFENEKSDGTVRNSYTVSSNEVYARTLIRPLSI